MDTRLLDWACKTSKVGNRLLVEKDYHLHSILDNISRNEVLRDRLLFKGGTCLIKAYIPYYRFSEDIDFGWQDPSMWEGKSSKQIEVSCMNELKIILHELEKIARSLDMGLNGRIDQRSGVFISNTGTKATLHFSYSSGQPNVAGRVKMEINFQDLLLFQVAKGATLRSFISTFLKEGEACIYPSESYLSPIQMACYSPEEIFAEKGRALLTRVDYKLRDTIDMAMLSRGCGLDLFDFEEAIKEKTRFTVNRFARYRDSLLSKHIPSIEELAESEFNLLIGPRPPNLKKDVEMINRHMDQLREELVAELK